MLFIGLFFALFSTDGIMLQEDEVLWALYANQNQLEVCGIVTLPSSRLCSLPQPWRKVNLGAPLAPAWSLANPKFGAWFVKVLCSLLTRKIPRPDDPVVHINYVRSPMNDTVLYNCTKKGLLFTQDFVHRWHSLIEYGQAFSEAGPGGSTTWCTYIPPRSFAEHFG